jgi:RHS repeat-associated protein
MGSVHGVITSSGSLTDAYGYGPYGTTYNLAGASPPLIGFDGYAYIGALTGTSFYYLINRWYSSGMKGFVSLDPAQKTTGAPYGYANDNPVTNTDPTGLGPSALSQAVNWFNYHLNPAYAALSGFSNAVNAFEQGCSISTVLGYGLEGVAGVVGMVSYGMIGADALDYVLAKFAARAGAGAAAEGLNSAPVYRYVSEGEARAAQNLGWVPNTDLLGQPRSVFYSPDYINSTSGAEQALQIGQLNPGGATESPAFRITASPQGAQWTYGGNVQGGTGVEMLTEQALKVLQIDRLTP